MIYNLFGDVKPDLLDNIKGLIEANPDDHELTINIDSYGGDLATAFALSDYLRSMKDLVVRTHIQGNCMSAATIVALIAKKELRSASKHSVLMIHSPLITTGPGMQDTETVSNIADTMKSALQELVSLYVERTGMDEASVRQLIASKREFYATEALGNGFIGSIDALYNKSDNYSKVKNKRNMKKSFLNILVNKLVKALINEAVIAEDGTELNIDGEIAVGTPASPDGIFVVDGATITVENGAIIDIIPAAEEKPAEEQPIENEGDANEGSEGEGSEKKDDEKKPEDVAEEAAKDVAETVEEEDVTDASEIEKIVKEAVETAMTNKYKPMVELVNKCGGIERLKALASVKHENKEFEASKNEKKGQRSLAELMAIK